MAWSHAYRLHQCLARVLPGRPRSRIEFDSVGPTEAVGADAPHERPTQCQTGATVQQHQSN